MQSQEEEDGEGRFDGVVSAPTTRTSGGGGRGGGITWDGAEELARGSGRTDRPRPSCRSVLFTVEGLV